jgi:uncharacterized membrane protein YphA (DoxX/SURF4 family)
LGLILLRIAIASHAIVYGFHFLNCPDIAWLLAWSTGSLAILAGVAILIGVLTPLAGAASATGYLTLFFFRLFETETNIQGDSSPAFYLAVISLALILLGPGAFSVDARLFGRREIILP